MRVRHVAVSFDVEQNTHPLPLLFCYHQDHEMLSPALTGNPVEQLKNRVVRITEPATKVRLLSTTHVSCFCLSPVRPTPKKMRGWTLQGAVLIRLGTNSLNAARTPVNVWSVARVESITLTRF